MNIEDLIFYLSGSAIPLNRWDSQVVQSFVDQSCRGTGFTEKQANLAIRILKKHLSDLSVLLRTDVQPFIDEPVFRYPIRQINNQKRMFVTKDDRNVDIIQVEFPFNEAYVSEIRKQRGDTEIVQWDKDRRAWFFGISESNIQFLMNFANKENFVIDETLRNYKNQIEEITENIEKYVPMLTLEENSLKFKNVSTFVPELRSTDILGAIFEARKYGILTWDNNIEEYLDRSHVNSLTMKFLSSDPGTHFVVNSAECSINQLSEIIKLLGPTLVVIPGGSELEKLKFSVEFFKTLDYVPSEMSVMFRKPNLSDKIFNDFVKNSELNNPIDEKTKVVFVSGKLPKPIIKSGLKFNSILNLGHDNVHYTLRDFLRKHENLIFYGEKPKQRTFDFGNLQGNY